MDLSLPFFQPVTDFPVLAQPTLLVKLAVLAALSGWSALLAHTAVANFHDGVRPVLPELLAERMTRPEVAKLALQLSLPFIVGYGLSFSLASGLIAIYLLLLPADVIGIAAPKRWLAAGLGFLWGVVAVLGVEAIFGLAAVAPIDFVAPLAAVHLPITYALVLFPALAVALQFGVRQGLIAVVLTLLVRLGTAVPLANTFFDANSVAMVAGFLYLLYLSLAKNWRQTESAEQPAQPFMFGEQLARLRANWPYLVVQGVLLALASRLWIFSGSEADFALLAQGRVGQAAVAVLVRAVAFTPLAITSALMTGVYQAVGFTLAIAVGYLSPTPWIAPILGGVTIAVELYLLPQADKFLNRFLSLRETADHLRASLTQLLEIGTLIGSAVAANRLIPGGLGLIIFVALYLLNGVAGQVVFRMAASLLAVVIIGLLANGLALAGLFPGELP